jgi:hypothetical protein
VPPRRARGGNEILDRQKAAAARLRRQVLGAAAAHPYFRDLSRQLKAPATGVDLAHVFDVCARARIVYLGEFHALQACQEFAAVLLEELASRAPGLALGVELFYTRQQSLLDRRQAGQIDDETFLRRIHYREEWGYPWDGYRRLLDRARTLDVPVYALDSSPRGGFDGLPRRDAHAARQIARLVENPDRRLLVLFGESHLSRGHIPRRVQGRIAGNTRPFDAVTVFQDPDPVYWALLSSGHPLSGAVRIDESTYAVFHTSPLEKYEAYRQVLERWGEDVPHDEEVDLTPAVHHLIEVLLRWLGIRPERWRVHHREGWVEDLADSLPEVYSGPEAQDLLVPVLEEHGRSAAEVEEARMLLEQRGALYDSRSNTMFLTRYLPGRAAGEGARFLRAAFTGRLYHPPEESWEDPAAQAYGAAYNEALAHLGSRLVDPASESLSEERHALATGGPLGALPDIEVLARIHWLEAHRRFEETRSLTPSASLLEPLRRSRSLRRALARDLGHRIGRVLLERVRKGDLDRRGLRSIFSRPLDPRRAQRQVLQLLRER